MKNPIAQWKGSHSFLTLLLLALAIFTFASCEDDQEDRVQPDTTLSEDATDMDLVALDLETQAEEAIQSVENKGAGDTSGTCPLITLKNDWGVFPNTITVDFGTDGCTGPYGNVRQGKLLISVSAPVFTEGAIRTIVPDNFFFNGVEIQGTLTITYEGLNSDGQICIRRQTENGSLHFPNVGEIMFEHDYKLTLIQGTNTPALIDNIWSITGSSSGTGLNGGTWTASITDPLVKRHLCPWIDQGIRTLTTGDGRIRTLDFGDGQCDRKANLTLDNGSVVEIKLFRRWLP